MKTAVDEAVPAALPLEERHLTPNDPEYGGTILSIPIELIDPNPHQPRTNFDEDALRELATSIEQHGILQPLIARYMKDSGRWELIAGERRLRAAKVTGLEFVPLIPKGHLSDEDSAALAMIENLQREDLDPIDEATAIRALRKTLGWKVQIIARKISRPAGYVEAAIRLMDLPDAVQHMVGDGSLSRAQADALHKFAKFPACTALAEDAAKHHTPAANLNVKHIETLSPWRLEREGLVRALNYPRPAFDTAVCTKCPFGARFGDYCFRPEHFDALAKEATQTLEDEQTQAIAAAAAAGVQLVDLRTLPHSAYKVFYQGEARPAGCTSDCPCRARGAGRAGREELICTDPSRYEKLQKAQTRKDNKQRRDYGKEQEEKLEAVLDSLGQAWMSEPATADAIEARDAILSRLAAVAMTSAISSWQGSLRLRGDRDKGRRWLPDPSVLDEYGASPKLDALAAIPAWRLLLTAVEMLARGQIHNHYQELTGDDPSIADWLVWGIAPRTVGEWSRKRRYDLGKSPVTKRESEQ